MVGNVRQTNFIVDKLVVVYMEHMCVTALKTVTMVLMKPTVLLVVTLNNILLGNFMIADFIYTFWVV